MPVDPPVEWGSSFPLKAVEHSSGPCALTSARVSVGSRLKSSRLRTSSNAIPAVRYFSFKYGTDANTWVSNFRSSVHWNWRTRSRVHHWLCSRKVSRSTYRRPRTRSYAGSRTDSSNRVYVTTPFPRAPGSKSDAPRLRGWQDADHVGS